MCDDLCFLSYLFRAIFSLDVPRSKDLLLFDFFWKPYIFAHKLIEALFLCNRVLLFNFGKNSCTNDAVITPSRKENHVVQVLCFDVNK